MASICLGLNVLNQRYVHTGSILSTFCGGLVPAESIQIFQANFTGTPVPGEHQWRNWLNACVSFIIVLNSSIRMSIVMYDYR